MTIKKLKEAFWNHMSRARREGKIFDLTFDQWLDIWEKSGHLEERGCRKGKYCMSRVGDKGGYEVGNVFIQLHSQNVKDAQVGKVSKLIGRTSPLKGRTRPNMSAALKGNIPWNKGKIGKQNGK